MENKRLTAVKTRIKPLYQGRYVKGEGFESNYVVTPDGLKVSRARILGTIMKKFVNEEGTYGFLVLDDETDTIRMKVFKDMSVMEDINQGDLVDVIGKIREYDEELYLMPEIIKKIENSNFLILRKAELLEQEKELQKIRDKVNGLKEKTSDLDEIKKLAKADGIDGDIVEAIIQSSEPEEPEKKKNEKKSVKEEVLKLIDKLDEDTGAEYSAIMEELDFEETQVEEVINDLLSEGTCYEPRPGRIKRL